MTASAASPFAVHLDHFRLLDAGRDTTNAAPSSAPLTAPLFFSLTIRFQRSDEADLAPLITALGVSVDFVADVASAKQTLTLLPPTPVSGPQSRLNSTTPNGAFLTAASASDSSASPFNFLADAPLNSADDAAPGAVYQLIVYLRDFHALGEVQLKHLLQVSMMRVRLTHLGPGKSIAESDSSDSRTEECLAAWNVIWRVRCNPQNEKELIRTVLDPLA
ncbi:conserved hypothetical protein [Leishmania braziliensis MHOM/BR/75/M2904]|uniref:Uncharacterized protein n=2 Tax=Leishmania braziliensis TaxID=5660 RepID=A4HFT6_LEIBR|nr:conserved hypothetical protein [Leishmania braziliensis MHOM/BR/75/M2904]CAJ2475336.1 unnamed protein product [Leishmania braziliensis]CAM45450.1 conserved hypothetical protein [Leishmania braziliensis MHOM/BR/75/M2904]SYZ67085.1 hypothetical_protein [Leishmania braziliensis MHOM/BR/75/M2904]